MFRKGSVTATKGPLREASREGPPKKRARRGAREGAEAGAAAPGDGARKNVDRKKVPKGTPAKRPKKKGPMDWFKKPGASTFDDLPNHSSVFTEVYAGVLRRRKVEYVVSPTCTTVHEVLTLVGYKSTCTLKVDDGSKSRHREWLGEVRRRVARGDVPSVRLSLKAVQEKRGKKVVLRLKPKTTPIVNDHNKQHEKSTKTMRLQGVSRK